MLPAYTAAFMNAEHKLAICASLSVTDKCQLVDRMSLSYHQDSLDTIFQELPAPDLVPTKNQALVSEPGQNQAWPWGDLQVHF